LLHGQRRELHVAKRAGGAVVADRLAGPQPAQQRQRVVDDGAATLGLDADRIALRRIGEPGDERHQQAASAQHVEARQLLRQSQHVAPGQQGGGAELHARVARARPGETDEGIEHGTGEDLRQPQRVEAELVDRRDELTQGLGRRGRARCSHADADLHSRPP
jgi:hypothetical protein